MASLSGVEAALRQQTTAEVRLDTVTRALYATDASVYEIQPAGVVLPRTREDLLAIVRVCHQHKTPYTMRGGGTSQGGQCIGAGLVVDASKYLNRVLEFNAAERWVLVEPGIVLDELNHFLKPHGLRFAPDVSTASRATVGGMIGNNSSGARSVLYGKTIDHVLELDVAFADGSTAHLGPRNNLPGGDSREAEAYRVVRRLARAHGEEVRRRFPRVMRRVMGYNLDEFLDESKPVNLAKLIVGSEGTLAVVLAAKVNLVPLPKAKAVLTIQFATLLDSLAATTAVLQHGPSAVEVMDASILDNTKSSPAFRALRDSFIAGDPGALLCVEFYGDDVAGLPPRLERLEAELRARGAGTHFFHAYDAAAQQRIWHLREASLGLSMNQRGDAKSMSFVEDTAVPPEVLRDYIERFQQILARHGTTAGVYAHASVGCLHVRPVINMKTADGLKKFEAIANEVAGLVLEFGGALSGEHGDGLLRSPFIEKMFGAQLYGAFREIKQAFDPDALLNPGKIIDPPPLLANLRYGAGYQNPNPFTFFDYSDFGGMGGAVDMCSGVGACRKKVEGTMCPSYMATRDERDSTRARANVLRLAMNGRLGEAGLGDDGVKETLELCLECRACKAECPVSVDVARFKSEFLADYYRRHGTPIAARLLGHAASIARVGSLAPRLANAMQGWGRGWAGIDARRRLPQLAARTLRSQLQQGASGALLFADTFINYYEPAIGLAVDRVMRAAGVPVKLAPNVCCGRPLISKGLLAAARRQAEENVKRLAPLAAGGARFVFCEPSCLSAVKEDAPSLLRGSMRELAERVAAASMLFEEFLERELAAGRAALALRDGPAEVVLLGHGHQKAMGWLNPAKALLARVPGSRVVDPDAGCCGMAGSFGYTHYDISKTMAERKLLPAVRGAETVVAAGTSCRHQMEDLAQVKALHPAQLLERLLK